MALALYAIVVDDHPLVRNGIAAYLKTHELLSDAIAVADQDQMIAVMETRGCAPIAFIDFWLTSGVADVAGLRARWPELKIIVMSGDEDHAVRVKARVAGAHGFLLKREEPAAFSRAVTSVSNGVPWFCDEGGSLVSSAGTPGSGVALTAGELGLSARQADVLNLLLMGQPNKRIAQQLDISESTVKEHVTAVLHKLAVPTRAAAIAKLRGCRLVVKQPQ